MISAESNYFQLHCILTSKEGLCIIGYGEKNFYKHFCCFFHTNPFCEVESIYSDGARTYVFGGHHGLVLTADALLAPVEQHGLQRALLGQRVC